MEDFFTHFTYIGVCGVLLASGLGLPMPEDVPLLAAGYLCAKGYASLEIMIPATMLCVVGADCMVYVLGRRYGHHVPRLPLLNRYLTPVRLAKAEAAFQAHGGKTLFSARFLPGLRAPMFFTAGVFRIPFWKFLLCDGLAAALSVPTFVLVAWFFSDHLDQVRHWTLRAQLGLAALIVALVAVVVAIKFKRRRVASAGT